MKKIIAAVLVVFMLGSLCACGSGADSSKDQARKAEKREELMSFNIELNGKALTMPFDYSALTELGYTLQDDKELEPNTYSTDAYVKNDNGESLNVQFFNSSKETKKYSECQICQMEVTLHKTLEVTLGGGIKFDKHLTAKKLIKTFGEPEYDFDEDIYRCLSYESDGYKQVRFMLYKKGNMKNYNTLIISNIGK